MVRIPRRLRRGGSHLTEEKTFFSQICFHYHQTSEKYLKLRNADLLDR